MRVATSTSWGADGSGAGSFRSACSRITPSRGFAPPAFADIRVRRSVRAKGFTGQAFEKRLGPARHRRFQGLGNQSVADGRSDKIRIKDPSEAAELLAFVQHMATERRRVLFFCSCGPALGCHRQVVTDLLLSAANKKGVGLSIQEWPGDLPRVRRVRPSDGRRWRYPASLALGRNLPPEGLATLPQGSIVIVEQDGGEGVMVTGPAEFHDGWKLRPVKDEWLRTPDPIGLVNHIGALRNARGWVGRQSEWA